MVVQGEPLRERVLGVLSPQLIKTGVLLLAAIAVGLFIFELVCHGVVLALVQPGQCRHFITLGFIENATTFSFSLTAFLLVGVAVVMSSIINTHWSPNLDLPEFILFLNQERLQPSGPELTVELTKIKSLTTNETVSDPDSVMKIQTNRGTRWHTAVIHELLAVEKTGGRLPSGNFVGRNLGPNFDSPDKVEDGRWEIEGYVVDPPRQEDSDLYFWEDEERAKIHWLIREGDTTVSRLRKRITQAVGFSISASVLGVILLGFPWGGGTSPDPWLLSLTGGAALVYIPASYLFTLVFLGMVWTSVGLLEILGELVDHRRNVR